ncbi:NAD(+) synthase [Butyrivibrio sp. CB08]|uniref:NAD(+) synthase n=1 Tax=Butyrivibrio sp. CB08 TaxID=2364879 RepID=UPI000EAA4204|nr:NAD(+) synthase [Butyrivibrio sp. CB08]RKM62147.1 NAD(+) synthase [Butyrivibrio sp. CB08]
MKNRIIQVAAVVPKIKVGDVNYNAEQIIAATRDQRDAGLIVFPELSITGYTCADLFLSDLLLESAVKALTRIANETKDNNNTAVVGVPICYDNNIYNCAAVLSQGRVAALIPKTYIPNYSEFYEGRWFASGRNIKNKTIILKGNEIPFGVDIIAEDPVTEALLGVEICEDLWIPDKPSAHAVMAGANIIANLSASDELIGKQEYRRQLVSQQSGGCYCGYIYVSSGTGESSTDMVFSGHALIAQSGSILSESIFPDYPHVSTAFIDIAKLMHDRRRQNTFENADSETYRKVNISIPPIGKRDPDIAELSNILKTYAYPVDRNPFVPSDDSTRNERCKRILQIQANGLSTRVKATGIRNLVIGISGGLDSTLALIVCHEAKKIIPDIKIIAYTMPNTGNTSELTYNNAHHLMKLIADEIHEVPIGEGVKHHLTQLDHSEEYQGEGDVTYENAQARMRTYILMDAANMKNGLVVGTGDLSELALGWCTYNGDHMSMYAVNASVPKTLVKFICSSYAHMCGNEELKNALISICNTPITPELTPNSNGQIAQMTEEKIGKYDLNDFMLFYTLRYGFEPSRTVALMLKAYPELTYDAAIEAARNFFKRFFTQQFKRSCLPDGPKVGSVSLSPRGDWRMPSDASVALWLEDLQ